MSDALSIAANGLNATAQQMMKTTESMVKASSTGSDAALPNAAVGLLQPERTVAQFFGLVTDGDVDAEGGEGPGQMSRSFRRRAFHPADPGRPDGRISRFRRGIAFREPVSANRRRGMVRAPA